MPELVDGVEQTLQRVAVNLHEQITPWSLPGFALQSQGEGMRGEVRGGVRQVDEEGILVLGLPLP